MVDYSFIKPKKDFYEAFMAPHRDRQKAEQHQAQQQAYRSDLERQAIENQYAPERNEEALLGSRIQRQLNTEVLRNSPRKNAAESLARDLSNQFQMEENRQQPHKFQMEQQNSTLEHALKSAQIQKYKAEIEQSRNPQEFNPLFDIKGAAQQLAAADWSEQQGDLETAEAIRGSVYGKPKFSNLTADEKRRTSARANALGISQVEAIGAFNQGILLEDLARQKGMSEEEIENAGYNYAPVGTTLNRAQNQLVAAKGGQYLDNFIKEGMEPYLNEFDLIHGISNKQVQDFILRKKHTPEERTQLARFIAASALIPEQSSLRSRELMGSNIGIESLRHLEESYPVSIRAINRINDIETRKEALEIFEQVNRNISSIEFNVATDTAAYADEPREIARLLNLEDLNRHTKGKPSEERLSLDTMSDEELLRLLEQEGE